MKVSWNLERIKADRVWDRYRGKDVRIAVLGTGVDRNHPALAASVRLSYDMIRGSGEGEDGSGHGTYVAGIIAAANKGGEKVGVAPEAELYCLKVLGDNGHGQPSSLIAAIEWCIENRMQIVNMSLGFTSDHASVSQALWLAANSGMVLVAAAGNDGPGVGRIRFPAAYDFVIGVTATDRADRLASVSSAGPGVDLCAPGDEINSTDRYSRLSPWVRDVFPDGNYTVWPAGTSFAAPHASGVAALVLCVNRSIAADRVRKILKDTAENLGLPINQQGAGLVNAEAATKQAARVSSAGGEC